MTQGTNEHHHIYVYAIASNRFMVCNIGDYIAATCCCYYVGAAVNVVRLFKLCFVCVCICVCSCPGIKCRLIVRFIPIGFADLRPWSIIP